METSEPISFYVLVCADGSLYAGIAKDVRGRLALHSEGKGARYTRGRGPLRLRASVVCGEKGAALSVELRFKRLPRAEKLRLVARKARIEAWVRSVLVAREARLDERAPKAPRARAQDVPPAMVKKRPRGSRSPRA